ncbi:hypothetical protein DL98DRAFT_538377 [Cadophora sp. DSE1049]|nr:hypothetical protein DL98DRAFT_538377 [Cadophora sp. DSE1049]
MEIATPPPQAKKGRRGNPKTKTGCVTCKEWKSCSETGVIYKWGIVLKKEYIATDSVNAEAKPECNRCISTGRTCDGYTSLCPQAQKAPHRSTPVPLAPAPATATHINLHLRFRRQDNGIPLSPSSNHDIPSSDLRALEHFHFRTSTVLGGWLLAPFWSYQLPQLAHSQPSTRHAIIAISTIHENIELFREALRNDPRLEPGASVSRKLFAERHYQSAVSALASSLAAGTASEEVALTSCAMFVVFNFMSGGNFARAVWHLQYGLEIFSRWKKGTGRKADEGSLEANLVELMKRISLDGKAMEETVPIEERRDVVLAEFEDLEAAGRAVEALAKEGLRLIRMDVVLSKGPPYDAAGRQILDTQVSSHISNLALWQSRLEAMIADPLFILTTEDKDRINQLRILHLSAGIWLYAGFFAAQGPQPIRTFETFISLVDEQYDSWQARGLEQYGRTFLFNKGLLPTITYIVTCSSDDMLRARALVLWTKSAPDGVTDVPRPANVDSRGSMKVEKEIFIEVDLDPEMKQIGLQLTPSRTTDGARDVRK